MKFTGVNTASEVGDLRVYDSFRVDGVFVCNPINHRPSWYLARFMVTKKDGNGNIQFWPSMFSSGKYKNVSNLPRNASPVTLVGGDPPKFLGVSSGE